VTLSLRDLPLGVVARVVDVEGDEVSVLGRRLTDLGFTSGTEVEAVRRAPLGDPVIYRVCGYDLCLRQVLAATIRVAVIP
jgi:Fe2+ transport system protein FeoA